jgi:hypothetical protein
MSIITDLVSAYRKTENAFGQILCIPNGAYSYSLGRIDRSILGSCWLYKNTEVRSGKKNIYVVTASHIIDNDDAYMNNFNVIGSYMYSYSYNEDFNTSDKKSVIGQDKLYILTTSVACVIKNLTIYNGSGTPLFVLSDNYENINLDDSSDMNTKENNAFQLTFGQPPGYSVTRTPFIIDSERLISGNNKNSNNYSLASIDLTELTNPSYISYSFYGNDKNLFFITTGGTKLSRWTNNSYPYSTLSSNPIIGNYGLIYGIFPNIDGKKMAIPLEVIGGDHRADIVMLRPDFNYPTKTIISEKIWNNLGHLQVISSPNFSIGDLVGQLGNPNYFTKSSLTGGYIRNVNMNSSSYGPTKQILIDCADVAGQSGGPFINKNGGVIGMLTFTELSTSVSGGPSCDIIDIVSSYIMRQYENDIPAPDPTGAYNQQNTIKNYMGIDYYDFGANYANLVSIASQNSPSQEITGFCIDALNLDGSIGDDIAVGSILLRATYTKTNSLVENLKFGIEPTNNSVFDMVYHSIVNDLVTLYYYRKQSIDDDDFTISNITINVSQNYPNYADYYLGDSAYLKMTKTTDGIVIDGQLNYLTKYDTVDNTMVKKLIVVDKKEIIIIDPDLVTFRQNIIDVYDNNSGGTGDDLIYILKNVVTQKLM